MRTDQIAELEIMLDDHGLEAVLDQLADSLERKAEWLCGTGQGPAPCCRTCGDVRPCALNMQAAALRAQAAALAAGRALTYATQAPLGV